MALGRLIIDMAIITSSDMRVSSAQKAAAVALTPPANGTADATISRSTLSIKDDGKIAISVSTSVGSFEIQLRPNLAELAVLMADGIKQADYAYTAFGRPSAEG